MKSFALLILFIFIFSGNCLAAEKNDWFDPTYSFKQIKTAVIAYTISPNIEPSAVDQTLLDEAFTNIFFTEDRKAKIKYLSIQQVEEMTEKLSGLKVKELKNQNVEQYEQEIKKALASICDVYIDVRIIEHKYSERYLPPQITYYTVTEYRTIYVYNPYGPATPTIIPVSVQKEMWIPGRDATFALSGVEFIMKDIKTDQIVWNFTTYKEEEGSTSRVTKTIFKNAKGKINKMIQKNKKDDKNRML